MKSILMSLFVLSVILPMTTTVALSPSTEVRIVQSDFEQTLPQEEAPSSKEKKGDC